MTEKADVTKLNECHEIYLCQSDYCPTCTVMEKILEDYIENGIIKTLDVYSEEADVLLIGSKLKYVPAFLVNGILCEYSVNTKDDGEGKNEVRIIGKSRKGTVDVGLVIKD